MPSLADDYAAFTKETTRLTGILASTASLTPAHRKFIAEIALLRLAILIENSMRPVVLGRKNYLFAGSEIGAEAAAILYSLTETCRRSGIHVYAYLVDVFRQLATVDPTKPEDIRALTPARWKTEQESRHE